MAYTQKDFIRDLALYTSGAVIGPRNTVKFLSYAAKKGVTLGGRVAVPAARAAAFTPAGRAALGIGALGAAYQGGAFDPVEDAINREVERRVGGVQQTLQNVEMAANLAQTPIGQEVVVKSVKRKASKFNKAIGAAMKAVKKSKSNGKPGTIRKPKATFARIVKVWKAKKAGRKVSTEGETGVISRNIKRYIG